MINCGSLVMSLCHVAVIAVLLPIQTCLAMKQSYCCLRDLMECKERLLASILHPVWFPSCIRSRGHAAVDTMDTSTVGTVFARDCTGQSSLLCLLFLLLKVDVVMHSRPLTSLST